MRTGFLGQPVAVRREETDGKALPIEEDSFTLDEQLTDCMQEAKMIERLLSIGNNC